MSEATPSPLPPPLESTRRRFEEWRTSRKAAERIPAPLWARAARCAARYGMHRTARALRLDFNSLKRHASAKQPRTRVASPGFVEIFPPDVGTPAECVLEIENRGGAKLRIHLRGAAVPDLAGLARSFASAET
jgi:hypothetical protein